jgi:7,8-dihydropterin-6-yl-methyl-4-(beta-D-ribofuranosyl)aminobenzene 5'-phosphate synthase
MRLLGTEGGDMLFSTCQCNLGRGFSRRSVVCGGGAGFISALVGAMIGGGQTARAQQVKGPLPTVDRLAVRMVTDNTVIQFIPNMKRDDLTVERIGPPSSPDAPPHFSLNGEWGLSMHAQSSRGDETRNVLIDFGYTPEVLLNNLRSMKVDPAAIDALVLSHGHYDHFGGMTGFLSANKGKLKSKLPFFVGGEECFCARTAPNGNQFGALDRKAITDADLALMMADGPAVVADHAFTTGKIAQTSFEKPLLPTKEKVGVVGGFGCFPEQVSSAKNTGDFIPDDFEHEIATVYNVKGKGLVILTSCSHRGVLNTIRQAQAAAGIQKIHAVIGGFHIVPPLTDNYMRDVVAELKAINPDYIMPAHCSGDQFYEIAKAAMPEKVIHSSVGTRFIFGA